VSGTDLDKHFLCLVIQGDPFVARATHRVLELYGLRPYHVRTLASAVSVARQWRFDVVLLDADSFGDRVADMLTLLRETQVPIVVSSSPFDEETQLRRLEQGATATVPKVGSMRLTALRLRKLAELGHHDTHDLSAEVRLGPLLIDTRRARASVHDRPLELSSRQLEILLLLATRSGEFVHRQDFASTSRHGGEEGRRSVDMHVSRIRCRLREMGRSGLFIHTVHGLGYCLSYTAEETTVESAVSA
jgi:two-component system OmpR family response regulator